MKRYIIIALVLLVGCKNNSHQEQAYEEDVIEYYEYVEQPTDAPEEEEEEWDDVIHIRYDRPVKGYTVTVDLYSGDYAEMHFEKGASSFTAEIDMFEEQLLYNKKGIGEYNAGTWCKFCRANGVCKAQADSQINAFDDFKEVISDEEVQKDTALLTAEEISKALKKGEMLIDWYEALQKTALEKLLSGDEIPGYKVVEGRSSRTWTNQDEALETLQNAGIEKAVIYDSVPKSLAQLEKLLGATKFAELVGKYVFKPTGKPTLASADDKRPVFNSAKSDFSTVAKGI